MHATKNIILEESISIAGLIADSRSTEVSRPGSQQRRRVKETLLDRDGDRCFWCERFFDYDVMMTVDRLIPGSQGGTYKLSNLVLSCERCNMLRSSMPAGEFKTKARELRLDELN